MQRIERLVRKVPWCEQGRRRVEVGRGAGEFDQNLQLLMDYTSQPKLMYNVSHKSQIFKQKRHNSVAKVSQLQQEMQGKELQEQIDQNDS